MQGLQATIRDRTLEQGAVSSLIPPSGFGEQYKLPGGVWSGVPATYGFLAFYTVR